VLPSASSLGRAVGPAPQDPTLLLAAGLDAEIRIAPRGVVHGFCRPCAHGKVPGSRSDRPPPVDRPRNSFPRLPLPMKCEVAAALRAAWLAKQTRPSPAESAWVSSKVSRPGPAGGVPSSLHAAPAEPDQQAAGPRPQVRCRRPGVLFAIQRFLVERLEHPDLKRREGCGPNCDTGVHVAASRRMVRDSRLRAIVVERDCWPRGTGSGAQVDRLATRPSTSVGASGRPPLSSIVPPPPAWFREQRSAVALS